MNVHAWAALHQGQSLTPYEFQTSSPKGHECIIKVRACGICHSDLHMIDNDWFMSRYPLVPGHEVVGEVTELGSAVTHLRVGDRVGVGWQSNSCLQCRDCLAGNENLCDKNEGLIVTGYGGFADYVKVDSRFAFAIPDGLDSNIAGPLLCGGVTVYSALRHAGMSSGQEIGVIGVGGLGHMAVQFASRLGNRVTVFTTSDDKAKLAAEVGAKEALVARASQPLPTPSRKLNVLINTAPHALDWASYLNTLDSDGTMVFVAGPSEPISLPFFGMMLKRRRVMGSPIGGRSIIMETLNVAEQFHIKPIVETYPMAEINAALTKARQNQVRYRAVLVA